MLRVKHCVCLSLSAIVCIIVVICFSARSDSNVDMGSKWSSSKDASPSPPSSSDLSVSDHIEKLIHQHLVMVFSKSYCPYSQKAKTILSKYQLGQNYHVMELDQLPAKADEYQDELGKRTGARTVPRVFIAGKCIGGGDDTSALDKRGDLERLLRDAKAIVDK